MKKIFTLFSAIAIYGFANAQNLSTSNVTTPVTGDITSTDIMARMNVINSGTSALHVKLQRYDVNIVSGSENSFCWGTQCYGSATYLSPLYATINASGTDSSFYGHYNPHGFVGSSTVGYTLFDVNNPNDSAYVEIIYDATVTGISQVTNTDFISSPKPNPANNLTAFNYNVANKGVSKIKIVDMLGNIVKTVGVSSTNGNVILRTTDMPSGIYFLSLLVDEKPVVNKKLVVSHN